jgi:hypothetical protein
MANINTAIRYVAGAERNPLLVDMTARFRYRDNAEFLAAVARRLRGESARPARGGRRTPPDGVMCIGLIGEYGLVGYGIRTAQEVIRVDRMPSHWSHAFLIASPLSPDPARNRDPRRSPLVWESTLEPPAELNSWVLRDGVGPRRIVDYANSTFDLFSQHCVPNIAVIAIGLDGEELAKIRARASDPAVDRLHYDIPGLLGTWFAYLTDRAGAPNPLATGSGVYCSAYVQLAYDAAGIDLAPGAQQRNTSPEHIWQGALYLTQSFLAAAPGEEELVPRKVVGWYCLRDKACVIAPAGTRLPKGLDALATFGRERGAAFGERRRAANRASPDRYRAPRAASASAARPRTRARR